jgi:hypothetical protein
LTPIRISPAVGAGPVGEAAVPDGVGALVQEMAKVRRSRATNRRGRVRFMKWIIA